VQGETPFQIAVVALLICMKLVRLRTWRLTGRRAAQADMRRHPQDALLLWVSGVTMLAGLVVYLAFVQHIAFAHVPLSPPIRWAAVAVAAAALGLLGWADHALGQNLSVVAQIKSNHTLITDGPYRWVRHPIYAAALWHFAALAVVTANWLAGGLLVGGILLLYVFRIPREERLLQTHFGDAYRQYAARTGRFWPRLFK